MAHSTDVPTTWRCPVCRHQLSCATDGRTWACDDGHHFDVAREGYVNLLLAGQRRSRQPGDSPEMVRARGRFLATGLYDPLSDSVAGAVGVAVGAVPGAVIDVGCGEGRHTRSLRAGAVLGIDVSKRAVAAAARADRSGRYAVASAADVPLADGAVDAAVVVFGPAVPEELARIVRPGGVVVAAHPGPTHLEGLRTLVYADARSHEIKPPLRHGTDWFDEIGTEAVTYELTIAKPSTLEDLFMMTPYRWHAPPDICERLEVATAVPFTTTVDVRVTTYRRRTS